MTCWHVHSYLAPNMLHFYQLTAEAIGQRLGVSIDIHQPEIDPLDDSSLTVGGVDAAFLCGLPLVRLNRAFPDALIPVAAPVPDDPRNEGKPVYFADFIVHTDSTYQTLDDLAGATFAYNDPGSNSGYHLPRYAMFQRDYPSAYFGKAVATGAHQQSIRWIIDRKADCAAIDSTVLAQFRRDQPGLAGQIRVIASSAPCPIPPLAIAAAHIHLIPDIQALLTQPDPAFLAAIQAHGMIGFAAVTPAGYEVIGAMFDTVEAAGYTLS